MIDYKMIIGTLNKHIKSAINAPIIELNTTQQQPPYPFAGYTVINPELKTLKRRNGSELTEIVEMMISYTFISVDQFDALRLSKAATTTLRHTGTIQEFNKAEMAIVDIVGFGNRDNFVSIETERRYGFDVRLRVAQTTNMDMENFDSVEIGNGL